MFQHSQLHGLDFGQFKGEGLYQPQPAPIAHASSDLSSEALPARPLPEQECPPRTLADRFTSAWLNIGIIAGATSSLAISASAVALAGSYLLGNGYHWTIVIWGILSLGLIAKNISQNIRAGDTSLLSPWSPEEQKRVKGVVGELCKKIELSEPHLVQSSKHSFAFLNRKGDRDILYYNPEVSEALTTPELKGILAHELTHAGDSWLVVNGLCTAAKIIAAEGSFWSAALTIFNYINPEHWWSKGLTIGVAGAGALAAATLVSASATLLSYIASRSNEIKTDLEAVGLTRNPESFLSGLRKVSESARNKIPKGIRFLIPLLTHPNFEQRAKAVRLIGKNYS